MLDPFDLNTAPFGEPLAIVIGQSTQWRREVSLNSSLFSLAYVMRRKVPGNPLDQTIDMVNVSSTAWGVDILPTDISAFDSGDFFWDLTVTRISDSRTRVLDSGEITVFESDADRRTHAHIMIAKIESLIENRADDDVANYAVKSRSITKMDLKELMYWRDEYRREVANATAIDGVFSPPSPNRSTLKVRFKD